MASNIPTRRTTRATRPTLKEDENVNARAARVVTRQKPSSNSTATSAGGSRASSLADAAAQGKRKREALGEVTGKVTNNKVKPSAAKGKEKEVLFKASKVTTTTKPAVRAPLRTVTARTRSSTVNEQKQAEDNAMIVDDPSVPPIPVVLVPAPPGTRRLATRASTLSSTATTASRRSKPASRIQKVEEVVEDEPVFKKQRTSSEAGEEILEILDEEPEVRISEAVVDEEQQQDWDDLDCDDGDDPLMVSEYVVEIFNHLKQVELTTMPNPNYMENQKELAWKMRGILMDWLIQVHTRFRLLPETLFLTVNIIDRFLSARVVSLAKLQLVGVTCMFIAAKVEEMVSPSVTNFIYCADSSYTEAEILQAEKYVLKTIDWNMSYPNPLNFLRRISKADDYNVQVRTVGKYLLEVGCLEWRLLAAPPSLLAATSMWLARVILDRTDWTANLRHYSSYPESALIPTGNLILNYLLKPISHESFYKKYASKRYMKASIFVREWCLERWEERSQVDLAVDLPRIKALASERQAENADDYEG